MKRSIKLCFGVLSVFFTIFGLSLNVSSDVSALKYAYNAFPIYNEWLTTYDSEDPSSVEARDISKLFNLRFGFNSGFPVVYDRLVSNDNFDFCESSSLFKQSFTSTSNSSDNSITLQSSRNFSRNTIYNKFDSCLIEYAKPFATSWKYDSIYTSSYNMVDGVPTKFVDIPTMFIENRLEFNSTNRLNLYNMQIPLTLSDDLSSYPAGTKLEWDFGFVEDSTFDDLEFSDNFSVTMSFQYLTSSDPSTFVSSYVDTSLNPISCSINRDFKTFTDDGEWRIYYIGASFHCEWITPSEVNFLRPTVYFLPTNNSSDPFVSTGDRLYFSASYFTTYNDPTWSGLYANDPPSGSEIEESPGYYQLYGYPEQSGCQPGDFLCDLSSLFSFDFLNPFRGLFDLFSDQSSCASIPILASMIHSEETQVCPWFSSEVRNIVTPVLGLSSMMLLFGFVVRWLGARSGNFIEDSGGVDSGGLHFQNKFRRK